MTAERNSQDLEQPPVDPLADGSIESDGDEWSLFHRVARAELNVNGSNEVER
jgi:hypothetical protein